MGLLFDSIINEWLWTYSNPIIIRLLFDSIELALFSFDYMIPDRIELGLVIQYYWSKSFGAPKLQTRVAN
jgi:hypothetical protein